MAKDLTKYKIKGTDKWLPKNRLVLSCLQQFFKDVIVKDYHPNENWPSEIQGGAGVIMALEDVSNERYYFMEDVLIAEDGKKYVVCNQWGSSNFEAFIERAVAMGYPIEASQKTQKLQIEISGLIQQILQGTCENSADTDYLEENPYDGIHVNFFKIDSDNLIKIFLDDQLVFESQIDKFGINQRINTAEIGTWGNPLMEASYNQILTNDRFQTTNEHDESCLSVTTETGLFVLSANADNSKFAADFPDLEERYALIDYGYYHLKTYPTEVSNFQISDLVFIVDSNLIDFTGSEDSQEVYYAFTHIKHKEGKILEFEIIENQSKSLDVIQGWIQDV